MTKRPWTCSASGPAGSAHVPSEGWLFSGDAFIHERVRVFRRDEDFAATIAKLERLGALDFDVLFCAHRSRLTRGREAIRAKLEWLGGVEDGVRGLHARGAAVPELFTATDPQAAERIATTPASAPTLKAR